MSRLIRIGAVAVGIFSSVGFAAALDTSID
jgi:hypothetical protein